MKNKTRYPYMVFSISLCLTITLFFGCAAGPVQVAPEKTQIESSKAIGIFTWQGRPYYYHSYGYGASGNLTSAIMDASSSERNEYMQAIYNSGVYEKFEEEFIKQFKSRIGINIIKLAKENYILAGKEARVDVINSAKKQGFDTIIEATVRPSMEAIGSMPKQTGSVEVRLLVRRVVDGHILWNCSTYAGSNNFFRMLNEEFQELATTAANNLVKIYENSTTISQ